ncbi:MAG: tetratricopeptide repeat protein, partial [Bryobacterales bacterium]|nr:tetratricopeptide repeat protein [Bryobacterales bacterium]
MGLSNPLLWFVDNELVQRLLDVDSACTDADAKRDAGAKRAVSHPAIAAAMRLYLQGKGAEARVALAPAVDASDPDALWIAGQMAWEQAGDPARNEAGHAELEEAFVRYEQLVKLQPGHFAANFNCGLCAARLERWADAIEHFHRAVVLEPDRAESWFALGSSLLQQSSADEARAAFARCLKLRPGYVPAVFGEAVSLQLTGRPGQAVPLYERLMGEGPRTKQILRNALAAAIHAGSPQTRRWAEQLLQADPESAVALAALARAAWDEGDAGQAEQQYRKLALREGAAFEDWYNLGAAACLPGRYSEARDAFRKALQMRPGDVDALAAMAICEEHCGDWSAAAGTWRELASLTPGVANVRFRLGVCLDQIASDQPASDQNMTEQLAPPTESRNAFERCLELDPTHLEAWLHLGTLHYNAGDLPQARKSFEMALEQDPANLTASLGCLLAAAGEGDIARAEALFGACPADNWYAPFR